MSSMRTVIVVFAIALAVSGREWSSQSSFEKSDERVNQDRTAEAKLEENHGANLDTQVYSTAQVWKVYTQTSRSRALIMDMSRQNLISIWGEEQSSLHIFVQPNMIQDLKHVMKRENIPYNIMIEDVQKKIDEQNPPLDEKEVQLQERRGHPMTWKKYHRLNDIYKFMDYLASTYPSYVTTQFIGKTYEGRELKLLKISNGNQKNKAIFIDGGIHAREWISPATVTYFINHIVENFNAESEDIKNTDWYILPVLNPDGYEYTFMNDITRWWRKNRNPSSQSCIGTDLNRNFGYHWGEQGSSGDPCSDIYRGTKAFSEAESKAVSDFIKSSNANFSVYLTYHSYGEYVLYPWGYDIVFPPDHKELDALGRKMAVAIEELRGTKYTVGSSASVLYPAAGGSDDWAKSQGIKYSYTIELSDKGEYAFLLPAHYIEPVGKESLAGLRVVAAQVHKE